MHLSSKPKTLSAFIIAYLKSTATYDHFAKKDHLHSFNIFGVIDSKRCGSLHAGMILFQNTLSKLTYLRVLNTTQMCTEAVLGQLSINIKQSELCIMSLSCI